MAKSTAPQVKCPACGRKQLDRGLTAIYYCDNCGGQFDSEPEEGGTYSNFNPASRLEREERRAAQAKRKK